MPSDDDKKRTRRAVMMGGVGAVVAVAAHSLGQPQPATATNGEAVLIGATRTGTGPTALVVTQASSSGIYGLAVTDRGVNSFPVSAAIAGHTKGVYTSALLGYAEGPYTGVLGKSTAGTGVQGESGTGFGVVGRSETSRAVMALALGPAGTALYANAIQPAAVAIEAYGRVVLDRNSGVAAIPTGQTSVTVTPLVDVTPGAFLLLTPKVNILSRSLWFTIDAVGNKFTIRMSSTRTTPTAIAWLLLG